MELKCSPCTDALIAAGAPDEDVDCIPGADTFAPVPLVVAVAGQQVAAVVTVPVCYACRKQQLGVVSKAGLAVA